jgi:tetrapyrrole methylase family protein/MazG family protein
MFMNRGIIKMIKEFYNFSDLIEIMKILRSKNGCPWDIEQTHQSLKKYLLEETYEVLECIDKNSPELLCEELGDLLLQVIFHAQIASENKQFDITNVIDIISKKMISRHAHVFGDGKCDTANDVLNIWEKQKKKEKGNKTHTDVLKSIPSNLPSLLRAYKVQQKAAMAGFDWDNIEDVFNKIHEEIDELKQVYKSTKKDEISEELGDSLFSLVNLARFHDIQPEFSLTSTTQKFIKRFEYVEKKATESGQVLEEMTLEQMDVLWNEAKNLPKEGE